MVAPPDSSGGSGKPHVVGERREASSYTRTILRSPAGDDLDVGEEQGAIGRTFNTQTGRLRRTS
jgi:hypothetical protein